ncbi:uncharacterized protein Bfra_003966 [Botrytis fragariae]|uniref:Uncharacterized protein n=1 Tax=Botrytis fragariae TaxID=1964551 RepID=A0A8H6AXU6_9HELO|nr:uncharacterized protein Bfra_003966 [Botrytis fragariae]KAF5875512.1 hypothetical protein Bfra_003966 [Botrytis fragariae]
MNDLEEAEFMLFLTKENRTMAWPSLEAKEEFDYKNKLFAEAHRLQNRIRIEPEQLARQRLRMAKIRARRQRRQNSKKE